jgi:hypothetical protein
MQIQIGAGQSVELYAATGIAPGRSIMITSVAGPRVEVSDGEAVAYVDPTETHITRDGSATLTVSCYLAAVVSVTESPVFQAAGFPSGAFDGRRALTTQTWYEAKIKDGRTHEISVDVTLAASGSLDTVMLTGANPVVLKSRTLCFDGVGINAFIYRDSAYTGGTPLESYNVNDINPYTPQSVFYSGATISLIGELTRAPRYVFGSTNVTSAGVAFQAIEAPQILKPNTAHVFRLTNRSTTGTQRVSSLVEWYEGPIDLPVI